MDATYIFAGPPAAMLLRTYSTVASNRTDLMRTTNASKKQAPANNLHFAINKITYLVWRKSMPPKFPLPKQKYGQRASIGTYESVRSLKITETGPILLNLRRLWDCAHNNLAMFVISPACSISTSNISVFISGAGCRRHIDRLEQTPEKRKPRGFLSESTGGKQTYPEHTVLLHNYRKEGVLNVLCRIYGNQDSFF